MRQTEMSVPSGGVTLAGTFATPDTEGPFPAALLLPGSGPLDRDGNMKRVRLDISRGLATGIGVYASAVVLSVCLSLPIWACILIIGIVTVIYDTLGGMAAVVYLSLIHI